MAPHAQDGMRGLPWQRGALKGIVATVTNFNCDAPDGKPAKVRDFDGTTILNSGSPCTIRPVSAIRTRQDAVRRCARSISGSQDMVERSNLKFNHKLHLAKAGVRDRVGKLRDPDPAKDKQEGKDPANRRLLRCGDCHQPAEGGRAEGGRLIAPVTMEQHCQSCHSLQFEPGSAAAGGGARPPDEVLTMPARVLCPARAGRRAGRRQAAGGPARAPGRGDCQLSRNAGRP